MSTENPTSTDLDSKDKMNNNETTYVEILSLIKDDSKVTVWSFETCKDLSAFPEFSERCVEYAIPSYSFVLEKFSVLTGTMGHYYLGLLFTTYTDFVVNIKKNLSLDIVTCWEFANTGIMYFLSKKLLLSYLKFYKCYFT